MITSSRNPKIQWVKALQANTSKRREERVFVAEGVRLLEEALAAGMAPSLILYQVGLIQRGEALLNEFSSESVEIVEVSPQVMKSASDTQTPQGILAVFPHADPGTPASEEPILIIDHLRDPGNLGTILRTSAGLGVKQVWVPPECADPFSPKALRAGMGAQFRLPIFSLTWEEIQAGLAAPVEDRPLQVLLAAPGEGLPFDEIDFRDPLALIIGGEAEGASRQAYLVASKLIHIPMPGGIESLNAAVAAGILLYEIARQRGRS
jgi:RNA methyltransferase, TrmH family